MKHNNVQNVSLFDLPNWEDSRGCLVAIESFGDIPFEINRVYYIFEVPEDSRRGFHAHEDLEQILICVHGTVKVLVDDGANNDVIMLTDPRCGLYIGPLVWREMFDFSKGAVLLVLASRHYNPDDYEKDYGQFKIKARKYANRGE